MQKSVWLIALLNAKPKDKRMGYCEVEVLRRLRCLLVSLAGSNMIAPDFYLAGHFTGIGNSPYGFYLKMTITHLDYVVQFFECMAELWKELETHVMQSFSCCLNQFRLRTELVFYLRLCYTDFGNAILLMSWRMAEKAAPLSRRHRQLFAENQTHLRGKFHCEVVFPPRHDPPSNTQRFSWKTLIGSAYLPSWRSNFSDNKVKFTLYVRWVHSSNGSFNLKAGYLERSLNSTCFRAALLRSFHA